MRQTVVILARKSDWFDMVNGTPCPACKGSGQGIPVGQGGTGACPTCRGFGKV